MKLGLLLALICNGSPVLGFLPILAARWVSLNVPKPSMDIFLPEATWRNDKEENGGRERRTMVRIEKIGGAGGASVVIRKIVVEKGG